MFFQWQVLRNGLFVFATELNHQVTGYSAVVAPFLSENDPLSGSVSYEVHEGNNSQHILSTANSVIHQQENTTNFNGSWLLVATWRNVHQYDNNYVSISIATYFKDYHVFPQTNTFQGMLVTDFTTSSYAVFTYHCGDMSFSDPGLIGFYDIKDGVNATHRVTYREFPHNISCLNEPNSPWVNVVYKISRSGEGVYD